MAQGDRLKIVVLSPTGNASYFIMDYVNNKILTRPNAKIVSIVYKAENRWPWEKVLGSWYIFFTEEANY